MEKDVADKPELLPVFVALSSGNREQVSCSYDNRKNSLVGETCLVILQGFMEDVCLGKKLETFVPQTLRCPLLPNALICSDFLHVAGGWALFSLRKQTQTSWILSPGSCSWSGCFMYKPSETSMRCSAQIQPAPALQPQHFQQGSYLRAPGTGRP